ncbi:ribonuclease H-like domain-containing protein [Tanacetum coccineum]
MTRRVLLRCDSTGDLYSVTAPYPIPHVFLVSQHTLHQRLGHPGGEVLRRLVSFNFISYNKEKPPVLCHACHACQLGKHVRLSFVSSSTVISSCFDIIHSDVWTSPIPDLSGVVVDETFSSVVKPGTIWTVLGLAVSQHWLIHQLDVKNAFLHGDLSDTVYMHQPLVFQDSVHPNYVFLSQKKYASEILERAHMVNCNPSRTPVDTKSKLEADADPISDSTLYRSLAGLPISHFYATEYCFMQFQQGVFQWIDLWEPIYLLLEDFRFGCLFDADWVGCPHSSGASTLGYSVFLGNNYSLGPLKRQPTLSRSSAQAEYRGVVNVVVETCWLRNLLRELHTPLSSATLVYCDNVSAIYLSFNPIQHQHMKHIEIDIHFVRDLVAAGQVRVLHVPSCYQYADIFTKGLPSALFEEFRTSLSVQCPPAPTARECYSATVEIHAMYQVENKREDRDRILTNRGLCSLSLNKGFAAALAVLKPERLKVDKAQNE